MNHFWVFLVTNTGKGNRSLFFFLCSFVSSHQHWSQMFPFLVFWLITLANSECPIGHYGYACAMECGKCMYTCDSQTGLCHRGCQNGWKYSNCTISYPVLRDPPTTKSRSGSTVVISWKRWTQNNDIGEGRPRFYLIQIKDEGSPTWKNYTEVPADTWSEVNEGFTVKLSSVKQDADQQVRVLVVDVTGQMQVNQVPIIQIPAHVSKTGKENERVNSKPLIGWRECLMWFGVIAGIALVIALLVILAVECRKRRKLAKDIPLVDVGSEADIVDTEPSAPRFPPGRGGGDSPSGSWYTEWYASRIYENDRRFS